MFSFGLITLVRLYGRGVNGGGLGVFFQGIRAFRVLVMHLHDVYEGIGAPGTIPP